MDATAGAVHAASSQKAKPKYVSLSSAEGASRMTVQLPGRYTCECHAQRHALINNCTECGRIVCAQVLIVVTYHTVLYIAVEKTKSVNPLNF